MQVTNEELQEANNKHLHYLEHLTVDRPDLLIGNLDPVRVFTYELIQVLNHEWLKERLSIDAQD